MARGESAFPVVSVPSNVKTLPVQSELPPFKPTIASALQGEPEPREFIVKGLIPKGELTLFAGAPDLGKSWLMLTLMCACGLGRPWLRRETRPCKSLALFSEDPADVLQMRRNRICKHYGQEPDELEDTVAWLDRSVDPVIFKGGGKFSSQWHTLPLWQEIRRYVEEFGIELLILDNALTVALLYESPDHVKSFCRWLISEAESLGIAIVLLHHPPADDQGGVKWYAGTAEWRRRVRNAIVLSKANEPRKGEPAWMDDGQRVLRAPKNNYLPHDHPMRRRGLLLEWQDGVLQRTSA